MIVACTHLDFRAEVPEEEVGRGAIGQVHPAGPLVHLVAAAVQLVELAEVHLPSFRFRLGVWCWVIGVG